MEISKVIIGVEVHVELRTLSKMFCGCSADHFAKEPNTQTCPVCLGLPGALPVPNKKAIEWSVLLGIALGGQIPRCSHFDRKNYFYPDLPKGYQISQYDYPLVEKGKLFLTADRCVRIKRVHLEEDTGKLLHETVDGKKVTLIDFNRSGVSLVEIVSEPDINSSSEAKECLEKIQQLVRYLGISDADMEKGSMRCEPNVNLEIKDREKTYYTPIIELKNINSFRFVQKAIDYEIKRQFAQFMEVGIEKGKGKKETRGWNEEKQMTVLQRAKEEANDYRYFPEPDIPPIEWSNKQILNFKNQILKIELPDDKRKRFIGEYGLSEYQAKILTQEVKMADFFEKTVNLGREKGILPNEVANVLINKRAEEGLPEKELIDFIFSLKQTAKLSDEEMEGKIKNILLTDPEIVEGFQKTGKPQALGIVVGMIRKETGNVVPIEKIIKILNSMGKGK